MFMHFSFYSRATYQYLIGAYAHIGNIDKINEIMETMKRRNVLINDTTYNYCVLCHLKRG